MKMKNRMKKHSLKFISVFLSLFLWVYVLNSEKVKFEKSVMLEYILPDDMVFSKRPAQDVTFVIEGPRAFVRTVAERDDRLVIDLNRVNSKRLANFQVDINPSQLSLPFGMVVEKVLPRKIPIRLEKKTSKIVPVKVSFLGSLPEKLTLSKYETRPSEVEIQGPKSVIAEINELSTRPVDLQNLVGQETLPLEVLLKDERLSLAPGQDLTLIYQLKASSANLVLKDLPIKFLSYEKNISSKIKRATVKLLVPEQVIKNRSNVSSSLQVWADVPEGKRGRVEAPLRVVLPPSMHLLEISPKSIIVNIE